jgi:Transposase, Mutator family
MSRSTEADAIASAARLIATGVNGDGKRKILGFEVTSAEDRGGLMRPAAASSLLHRTWVLGTGWRTS